MKRYLSLLFTAFLIIFGILYPSPTYAASSTIATPETYSSSGISNWTVTYNNDSGSTVQTICPIWVQGDPGNESLSPGQSGWNTWVYDDGLGVVLNCLVNSVGLASGSNLTFDLSYNPDNNGNHDSQNPGLIGFSSFVSYQQRSNQIDYLQIDTSQWPAVSPTPTPTPNPLGTFTATPESYSSPGVSNWVVTYTNNSGTMIQTICPAWVYGTPGNESLSPGQSGWGTWIYNSGLGVVLNCLISNTGLASGNSLTFNLSYDPNFNGYNSSNPNLIGMFSYTGYQSRNNQIDFLYIDTSQWPVNQSPSINPISNTTLNEGDIYSASNSFTDSDSSSWTGTVDYGDGSGVQPLVLSGYSFSLSHIYTTTGIYTVTVRIIDNQGLTGQATATITVVKRLTALSPAQVWIGLKNSDDVGIKFDLQVEAYVNGNLVSSGQLDSVAGGSSGFNNARLQTIPFNSFSPVDFPAGSALGIKLYVRNACSGSTHNSGTARLWYNDSAANSQFGATIGSNTNPYYLLSNYLLGILPGVGPKQYIDIAAGSKCSAFKPFGTWTITP